MQLLAAMGPPGGGRNAITNRLLTRFNIINMTFPAEKQIVRIYGTMLNQQLYEFHNEVKSLGKNNVGTIFRSGSISFAYRFITLFR